VLSADIPGYHGQPNQRRVHLANNINGGEMKKIGVGRSRQIARKKFMDSVKFNGFTRSLVVHHIDGDPFNNDIENLRLMTRENHTAHHVLEHHRASQPEKMREELKELESLITLYNDGSWHTACLL